MDLKQYNLAQLKEALGDDNRWFFFKTHNRNPNNDTELILHYIENGGATGFRERYNDKKRRESATETDSP